MEYTQERLFSYALWYTGKYPVSTKRLREKLHEKCSNASIVEAVIVSMEPYHSDATEIRSCIETLVHLRKPKTVIRQKLRIKGFIPDEFEAILGEFWEFDDLSHWIPSMEKRVQTLIERGNGPRVIMQDLLQKFPQWKDEIKKQCSTLDEEALIAQYWADEIRTGNPKKLFDTLIRKGFSYEAVTRISKSR